MTRPGHIANTLSKEGIVEDNGAVSRSHASHGAEKSSPPIGFDRGDVFVVMGGDFPDAAFSTEEAAETYCGTMRADDKRNGRRIYWRIYRFPLNGDKQ